MTTIDIKSGVTSSGLDLSSTTLNVSSGGTVIDTTLNSGASAHIYSSAVASGATTVNSGAQISVYSGAMVGGTTTVNGKGVLTVYAGGTVANVILESGAQTHFTLGDKTNLSGSYVSGGTFSVSGKKASGIVIDSDCSLTAYATGVSAAGITIKGNGKLNFNVDGTAKSYIQGTYESGSFLLSGGVASGFLLNKGVVQNVSGGGITSKTILYGDQYVSGGTAVDTELYGNQLVGGNGVAKNTSVYAGGKLIVVSGTASDAVVDAKGTLVLAGGTATGLEVSSGGVLQVAIGDSDAVVSGTINGNAFSLANNVASDFILYAGGILDVQSGTAVNTIVSSGGSICLSEGILSGGTICRGGSATLYGGTANAVSVETKGKFVLSGGAATGTTIAQNGVMAVSAGAFAAHTEANGSQCVYAGGSASGTTLLSGGRLSCYASGTVEDVTIDDGAKLFVSGAASDITVSSGGTAFIYNQAVWGGKVQIDGSVVASSGAIIDFTVADWSPSSGALISDWSKIVNGAANVTYTMTVDANQEKGVYTLAKGAADFANTVTVKMETGILLGTVTVGEALTTETACYVLNKLGDILFLDIIVPLPVPTDLSGSAEGISWKGDCTSYVAEYTQDGYTTGLRVQTINSAVDAYGMPEGTYDWRVRNSVPSTDWVNGSMITAAEAASPEKLASDADGIGDLFFGRASEVWSDDYMAQHLGLKGGWSGTNETVQLFGKNRITDVFAGSGDANLLVLTDDGNGDALFVDDVYSAFPGEEQSRLSQLDEIWAGAGNDVIDMTSQEFTYDGDGLTLRGGSGDDTLWSNKGDNFLFGDAGNDRLAGAFGNDVLAGGSGDDSMQGGGGKDIFTFGANWGSDTVEQLDGGSIILWFAEDFGLTFTEEGNDTKITSEQGTILVKGLTISETKSCCRYGSAGYEEQYAELVEQGAFAESSTSSIFEEEGKGRLAML